MPTVEWNKKVWDKTYSWNQAGDEWSGDWGGSESQWYGSLLPRIHKFLPAGSILEIGPGYGRWTKYLAEQCVKLVLVDISESCIEACRERFKSYEHIEYYANDGFSLERIDDNSLDVVFSFDSLVHAEIDVMSGYLGQISKKLTKNGVGIIHHSNLCQYKYFKYFRELESFFKPRGSIASDLDTTVEQQKKENNSMNFLDLLKKIILKLRLIDRTHMRALSMSAKEFREIAEEKGLTCISQEIIPWGSSKRAIDCISIFTLENSKWSRKNKCLINKEFMREARYLRKLSTIYRMDG